MDEARESSKSPGTATWGRRRTVAATVAIVGAAVGTTLFTAHSTAATTTSDWGQYQLDLQGSGDNTAETALTALNASSLRVSWVAQGGTASTTQPLAVGGVAYWGSWDGNLHATSISSGVSLWTRPLGFTTCSVCTPTLVGMASTPAFGAIGSTPVLWVADGGNDTVGAGQVAVYAINAADGTIIWRTNIVAVGTDTFAWSSVRDFNGSLYFSTSSLSDNPVIPGRIYQLNDATGAIQTSLSTGGGVWGTPTFDTATGDMYVPVGAGNGGGTNDFSSSLLELSAANLAVVAHWTIPTSQQVTDGDFGSVPTLFDATINGVTRHLVGLGNKNGIFYAWDRTNVAAGPLWERAVAIGGQDPQGGNGTISPAVWDGTTLYVAGGNTTINGTQCAGGVRALNPADGTSKWEFCTTTGHVLGALAAAPGVIVVPAGASILVLSMATGQQLFAYKNPSGALFWGAPSVGDGHVFAPGMDGTLTALAPNASAAGPSITLVPASQSAVTGVAQTVTAAVVDGSGSPLPGTTVTFTVVNGPNVGQSASAVTDAAGHAPFTVTSATAGMDSIQGSFVDSTGTTRTSNPVQVTFTTTTGGVVISNLTVYDTTRASMWSVQPNLQVGAVIYGDRAYTLTAAPSLVTGDTWIRDTNSSKTFTGNPVVTFSINQQADVFIGMDKRVVRPTWLDATWSDTGLTETATGGPVTYELFRKTYTAGTVALGPLGTTSTAVALYTIAVR
jgi:hypothetical protein